MEMVSDGTGGGKTAGLAWASSWQTAGTPFVRGTGWVPGDADSDRAELGGLVQQLTEVLRVARAGQATGQRLTLARLLTDCEGAMAAAEWSTSAPTGRVLRHKNRVLLLEWRGLWLEAAEAGVRVELGWIKGHAKRRAWPQPVQEWCDTHAVEANDHADKVAAEEKRPSRWDAPFMLWDKVRGVPVWGGWGQAVVRRSEQELATRARLETSSAAGWMRLRAMAFKEENEWDSRALADKHGAEARGRIGAQWDTVFGPGRWTEERAARKSGCLAELERSCRACHALFTGRWETHHTERCTATEGARAFADGLLGAELLRQMAFDPPTVQRMWDRWRSTWMAMRAGTAWFGFLASSTRLPREKQPPRTGVGAADKDPVVFSRAQKARAVQLWKAQHPEGHVEEGERPADVVEVAVDSAGTQVLPIVLFLLFERWQARGHPSGEFAAAAAAAVRRERERAASAGPGRKARQNARAWPGCFVDWAARHAPAGVAPHAVAVLFTGLLNHAGEPAPGCTEDKEDAAWGMAGDAWWEAPGVERRWGTGTTEARALQGHPPADEESVRRLCRFAQAAVAPLTAVLPVLPGTARGRVDAAISLSGGRQLARVAAGDMRFVPIGF